MLNFFLTTFGKSWPRQTNSSGQSKPIRGQDEKASAQNRAPNENECGLLQHRKSADHTERHR